MNRWMQMLVGGASWVLAAQVIAEPDNAAAYARIDAERAQQTAAFNAQEAECFERFAVNACLKDVNVRRIAALRNFTRQEQELRALERRQKGDAQLQRLQEKAQERIEMQAQDSTDTPAQALAERLRAQQEKQAEHAARANPVGDATAAGEAPRTASAPSAQEQAQNQESYARKLADAEQKREAIAKRLGERTGQPLPPLPLPAD